MEIEWEILVIQQGLSRTKKVYSSTLFSSAFLRTMSYCDWRKGHSLPVRGSPPLFHSLIRLKYVAIYRLVSRCRVCAHLFFKWLQINSFPVESMDWMIQSHQLRSIDPSIELNSPHIPWKRWTRCPEENFVRRLLMPVSLVLLFLTICQSPHVT